MLGSDPARSFGREAQDRPRDLFARENAVARAEHFIESFVGNVHGPLVEDLSVLDGIDGEGAQAVAQMAPGVEMPVVAIVVEALGRDFAFAHCVGAACVEADDQALPPQERRADGLEVVEVEFAGTDALDADAALQFLGRVVGSTEQAAEAGEQRLDLRPEQAAGVEIREQMLHGQQGVDFLGG
jgi:hypothetical protein